MSSPKYFDHLSDSVNVPGMLIVFLQYRMSLHGWIGMKPHFVFAGEEMGAYLLISL